MEEQKIRRILLHFYELLHYNSFEAIFYNNNSIHRNLRTQFLIKALLFAHD